MITRPLSPAPFNISGNNVSSFSFGLRDGAGGWFQIVGLESAVRGRQHTKQGLVLQAEIQGKWVSPDGAGLSSRGIDEQTNLVDSRLLVALLTYGLSLFAAS